MKKVLAFGASNSQRSINKRLAKLALDQLKEVEGSLVDLNDFPLPIYGIDLEKEEGIPAPAQAFKQLIKESDGIIISLAEHNGNLSAVFKNLTDWVSRIEKGTWANKKMLLLATSPGGRGGKSVLDIALQTFPYRGAEIVAHFSLPSFKENFSETGITNPALELAFRQAITTFQTALENTESIPS